MEFRILGPVEVWREGERLPLGGWKPRALLAILLIHRNQVVAADRLIELLWDDDPPETAAHSLQVHISQLRKVLSARALESRPPGYLLHAADAQVDAGQFEAHVGEASRLRNAGDLEGAVRTLQEALGLWRGQPLADVAAAPFALAEVARLSDLRLRALEERAEAELALGRHAELVPELEALVAEHPLRELLCAQLMLALYRSGRQAEACDLYYRTRKRLVDELGMEPGSALKELLKDILKQDPSVSLPQTATGRRLPTNLPYPLTSFVGRQTELSVITQMLADHRLVTLTGTGGIGKTRLAIEVARQILKDQQVPVYFIELAPLADAGLVPQTMASVLRVPEQTTRSFTESIIQFLTGSDALLVVDNCEHLLGAAAALLEAVLTACPKARVLATSRERLNVLGEHVWPVAPLRAPDPRQLPSRQDLARFEAIQLFTERAMALQPSFFLADETAPAVARICHSLDGMPLALELAAAQTSLLSPDQIVIRLDDRFRLLAGSGRAGLARHQTLRATIEWSHNLLNPHEQRLFRRLSVFAGTFSLEGVETVCAATKGGTGTILPTLRRLVDASLVLTEEGQEGRRYRMLETLRQYSRERLVASGEMTSINERLVSHLAYLAADAEDRARGPESPRWLAQMEHEHDSVRAALDWSASNDPEAGLRLAHAWVPFWIARGYIREGYERLTRGLSMRVADEGLRAISLNAAGRLAMWQGNFTVARPLLEEALHLLRRRGPPEELALALLNLDAVLGGAGERGPDSQYLDEALTAARTSGQSRLIAIALNNLAELAVERGHLETARRLFRESLAINEATQNLWGIASVLEGLAAVDVRQGKLNDAAQRLRQSLALSRRRDDKLEIGEALLCLANVAALEGRADRALRLAGAAESVRRSLGINMIGAALLFNYREQIDSNLRRARSALGAGTAEAAWDEGSQMTIERAIEYAMTEQVETPALTPLSS